MLSLYFSNFLKTQYRILDRQIGSKLLTQANLTKFMFMGKGQKKPLEVQFLLKRPENQVFQTNASQSTCVGS